MAFTRKAKRLGYFLAVAGFALAMVSTLRPEPAAAYGLISSRYIRMSSSGNGATNTAYAVGFTTVTDGQTIGSIKIEFCSNNPIIGDACTAPAGFNTNDATLSLNNLTGNATGLTIDTSLSNANTLILARAASAVSNGTIAFELGNGTTNGLTNPTTTNTTFFARITTHNTADGTGVPQDAGGVALSTANLLNVTAKVQETLIFCVYTLANCGAGGSDIVLGDSNGVLADTATTYTDTASYDLASNALGGVIVRMKGGTLTSGAFTIDPTGAGGATCFADTVDTSVEQFGVRVSTFGAGQQEVVGNEYGCLAGNHKFEVGQTNTMYGQPLVETVGATDVSSSTIEFAAKAAGTTEAGIYTTTLQLIATATY